ncbi:hypothetical protein FisN_3Hh092 [Fistulifera solaris]|uniref:Uncharacterized protein n=1 Tax=Fistulifera solaris TaxID=1519565 RepID=A0A1Z5JPB9_FISSO|nr:hypothetical protein FisN_3Hh092 [Fistulifera solaris]|eukprot:GAX15621.1 hypothetical protein FisN_3Hh092 [Fistulifera solaris]
MLYTSKAFAPLARGSIQQRRTFINWMTNYPDKIVELKRAHQAGGRSTFTWLKQPQDKMVTAVGATLMTLGFLQLIPGYYRLASGKGKLE